MKEVTIYGLVDPRTYEVRYVGQTSLALKRRLQGHLAAAHQKKEVLHFWIESMRPLTPRLVNLQVVFDNKRVAEKCKSHRGDYSVSLASVMEAKWLKRAAPRLLMSEIKAVFSMDDVAFSHHSRPFAAPLI
jgi:hypothetical protein